MEIETKKLIQFLQGQIDRLQLFDGTPDSVRGALLIELYSSGYLKKKEEVYIKNVERD